MSLKSYWERSPKPIPAPAVVEMHIKIRSWMTGAMAGEVRSDNPDGTELCKLIEADDVIETSFTCITVAMKKHWCIDDITCRKCRDVWSLVYDP